MKPLQRVAFIGLSSASVRNRHLYPRSSSGVSTASPDLETSVVAMTDLGRTYDYPPPVRLQIHDETIGDYVDAAEFLNNAGFDILFLFNTNTESSAVRPAGISSSSYRASKCRS
jgi:hypothetical protein